MPCKRQRPHKNFAAQAMTAGRGLRRFGRSVIPPFILNLARKEIGRLFQDGSFPAVVAV
jgi:hypothetical protein